MTNEAEQKQSTETGHMEALLAGAAEREIAQVARGGSPIPARPPSLVTAIQPVPGIKDHFTKSVSRLNDERVETKKMIDNIEAELQKDMATFADLANRINTRTHQLGELKQHQVRLTMAATMAGAMPPAGMR